MAQEQSFVRGVDFICIPTQNFDRAKAFYEDVLGLKMSKRWGEMPAGEFETGSLTIAIMQADAFQLDFAPHRFPISFRVDDVAARKEELEAQGVEFHTDVIDSGVCHQAIFSDPDGNALNLHHRYAPPGASPGNT